MQLSDIGILWLWFLLAAWWGLKLADNVSREGLWNIPVGIWKLFRIMWDMVSYRKETEPVGESFKGILSQLLRSGFNDATAYVKPKYSKRLIEFGKYIRAVGEYGIELRFPGDQWAAPYFGKVREYCEAHHIPYLIETDAIESSREILRVDFGHDAEGAANLTVGLWTEVFNLPENAPRSLDQRRVSPFGELVDRPRAKDDDDGGRLGLQAP